MLLEQLEKTPETINFKEVIAYIDENYDFTPTKFINGNTTNEANQTMALVKFLVLLKQINLSKEQTLSHFWRILQKMFSKIPRNDHQNIRNFIEFSWDGISFDGEALKKK